MEDRNEARGADRNANVQAEEYVSAYVSEYPYRSKRQNIAFGQKPSLDGKNQIIELERRIVRGGHSD